MNAQSPSSRASVELPPVGAAQFRKVMGQFATGVTVVTAETGGNVHGMTASAFLSGSLDPPLCVLSVGLNARLFKKMREGLRFGVSVLAHDQMDVAIHFAGRPDPNLRPRFQRIANAPVIDRAAAHMVAEVTDIHPTGDHALIVGRLLVMDCEDARAPLLHHAGQFASLVYRPSDRDVDAPAFW